MCSWLSESHERGLVSFWLFGAAWRAEGEWIASLDLVEKGDKLVVKEMDQARRSMRAHREQHISLPPAVALQSPLH